MDQFLPLLRPISPGERQVRDDNALGRLNARKDTSSTPGQSSRRSRRNWKREQPRAMPAGCRRWAAARRYAGAGARGPSGAVGAVTGVPLISCAMWRTCRSRARAPAARNRDAPAGCDGAPREAVAPPRPVGAGDAGGIIVRGGSGTCMPHPLFRVASSEPSRANEPGDERPLPDPSDPRQACDSGAHRPGAGVTVRARGPLQRVARSLGRRAVTEHGASLRSAAHRRGSCRRRRAAHVGGALLMRSFASCVASIRGTRRSGPDRRDASADKVVSPRLPAVPVLLLEQAVDGTVATVQMLEWKREGRGRTCR